MVTKKNKIIIWGYPIHSHTHSYIHEAWFKVFRYLGYEVYWFDDENFPLDFEWNKCTFISEGYADKNIPLVPDSLYFVHIAVNPRKYLNAGCRLIDLRFNVHELRDVNYQYSLNRARLEKLDSLCYYDKDASDDVLADNWKSGCGGYEAVYLSWATNLLPFEFQFENRFRKRSRRIHWVGTIGGSNALVMEKFQSAAKELRIRFVHHDPWKNPTSSERAQKLITKSLVAPDIRGDSDKLLADGTVHTGGNHKKIGYIPCRIFKNVSYGQLGGTNSRAVSELFEGRIVYDDDEATILYKMIDKKEDFELIEEQMRFVQSNHTFVNRARALIRLFDNK